MATENSIECLFHVERQLFHLFLLSSRKNALVPSSRLFPEMEPQVPLGAL